MSNIRKNKLAIFFFTLMMVVFAFGCKKEVAVNDIHFELGESEQIVLLIGETFKVDEYVKISPANATNKNYTLESFNEEIIKIEDGTLIAVSKGSTQIKIISEFDPLKQDLMTVVVENSPKTLSAPQDLRYDGASGNISFNSVSSASSYSLFINDEQFDLGNSNVFNLSELGDNAYDNLLKIKVRANAPSYTQALKNSDFTTLNIYQVGNSKNLLVENGEMTFEAHEDVKTNVYFSEEQFLSLTDLKKISLKNLNSKYAGSVINISIEHELSSEIKQQIEQENGEVLFFKSNRQSVNVNVLGVPNLQLTSSVLSWQNIAHADGYEIYINSNLVATTKINQFDLMSSPSTIALIDEHDIYNVKVEPVLSENSKFVAKTVAESKIKVTRLEAPELSISGNKIVWNNLSNTSAYAVKMDNEIVKGISDCEFSTVGYESGNHTISVSAVAKEIPDESDVYYLTSLPGVFEFNKQVEIKFDLTNYTVTFNDLGTDIAIVEIEKVNEEERSLVFEKEINGAVSQTLSLLNEEFLAGEYVVVVKRKANTITNSVESNKTEHGFVQLAKVETFNIIEGVAVATVEGVNTHENATIKIEIKGGTPLKTVSVEDCQLTINTTDSSKTDDFLFAGDYMAKVFVLGDGSTTFSYRDKTTGEAIPCKTIEFGVLEAPTLELKSVSEEKLVIGSVANAGGYNIYESNGGTLTPISSNVKELEIGFDSFAGEKNFAVQAVGGNSGKIYLPSIVSETITICKLTEVELLYDNETGVLNRIDENNEATTVASYEFKIDGVLSDYDFSSTLTVGKDATLTIQAIANKFVGEKYYLNSNISTLQLFKLNGTASITINNANQLEIETEETRECDLEVVFNFGTFVSNNGKLTNGTYELPYVYNDGKYVVDLIDSAHNVLVEALKNEFTAKVRLLKDNNAEGVYESSVYSNTATLSLKKISNSSAITINNQNQLVITPNGHAQQYGLVVIFNNDEDLTFKSNGSNLVKGEIILPFVFESGSYIVDMLDEKYDLIINTLNNPFNIKVKYTHDANGISADMDSDFCDNKTIQILSQAGITRDGENLKISNVNSTYTYQNYALWINDSQYLTLEESGAKTEGNYIVFDVKFVFDNLTDEQKNNVNKVQVIVLNLESNTESPILSNKGEPIYIQKTSTVVLSKTKNNDDLTNDSNNSVMISFNTTSTPSSIVDKEYVVEIYNESGANKKTIRYNDTNAENGAIEFGLDDVCDLEGVIYISCYVTTKGSYTDADFIQLFNSKTSNILKFEKIGKVQNLKVSNSILTWDDLGNVCGYEVYEKLSNGYQRLTSTLLTVNEYDMQGLDGQKNIVVKAISNDLNSTNEDGANFTNSSYSDSITINKLSKSTVSIENGKIKVNLPSNLLLLLMNDKITLLPEVKNRNGEIVSVDLKNLDGRNMVLSGTTLLLEPYLVMSYNAESLLSETLTFKIRVENKEAVDGVFYLNSDETKITAYGLFKPTQISKTTQNNDSVELITWVPSDKNKINGEVLNVKYIFKIDYTNGETIKTYYSNDPKLKYYDASTSTYKSYPEYITGTSAIFPAGYDEDENGDGVWDITFEQGTYQISIQTVPNTIIEGYNLCSSKFTDGYKFEILSKISPLMGEGKLVWVKQDKASKYVVSIFEQDSDTELLIDTIPNSDESTIYYDFNNTKLNEKTGVFKVLVKAISTREDAVNSVESDPIYIYRLPEATDIYVDDGNLILTASAFFNIAKIELVDENQKVYPETFDNSENALKALEELGITNWKDFHDNAKIDATKKYFIKLDNQALAGKDYTINVTLIGNSNTQKGFISSSKSVSLAKLTVTKLQSSEIDVEKGVLTFSVADVYDGVDFNYSFNGTTSSTFWHKTVLFRLDLTYSGNEVSIYAVDYYTFIQAIENGNIDASEYEVVEYDENADSKDLYAFIKYPYTNLEGEEKTLIFNVYKDNTINLLKSNLLRYYPITTQEKETEIIYVGATDYLTIDFVSGGSFTFDVFMLGGDSIVSGDATVGHISAFAQNIKTFERYGIIKTLSTEKGEIAFETKIKEIEGNVVDYPVYRLTVKIYNDSLDTGKIFYLYHATEKTGDAETDAENAIRDKANATAIAERFEEGSSSTAIIDSVKESADGKTLYFDLSQYIEAGIYNIRIQVLAGVGTGVEDEDFLLNGQTTTTDYTVHKLSSTELSKDNVDNGVLTFEQSYYDIDNGKEYYDNYEITIIDGESEYVFEINENNGAEIDTVNHIVKYNLPEEILIDTVPFMIEENKIYQIKIRAVAKNRVEDQSILNATYLKSNEDDLVVPFKKALGIESIFVGDGILKWVVKNETIHKSTSFVITFTDKFGNDKTIKLSPIGNDNKVVDEEGNYLYHEYEFGNGQYDLTTTGKVYIQDGFNYSISAYVTSNEIGEFAVLNSNIFKMDNPITRLKSVENIRTENGILVWDSVDGATSYEVSISGLAESIVVEHASLDLIEKGIHLPIGTYSVYIKAKADTILNAMDSSTVGGFAKLNAVATGGDGVTIDGFTITWNAVENAEAYKVIFTYVDSTGETRTVEEQVEVTEFTVPEEVQGEVRGTFKIEFTALGKTNPRLFNSETSEFTTSKDAPLAVEQFYFDETTKNRFVVKVKDENFTNGDKLLITYNLTEYKESGNIAYGRKENYIQYKQDGCLLVEEEGILYHYYYLPLTIMGEYKNPMIQVVRTGTISSDVVITDDLTFNLFRYGDGTTENAYQIYSATELMNIKYFNSANFILKSRISFEDVDVQASLTTNGALISDEFHGILDGNNNEITFASPRAEVETIELNSKLNFALFGMISTPAGAVNKATIKNLKIGQENRQLILSNMLDSELSNVLKLSMIATGANNSIFENVNIWNFKIQIESSNSGTITHKEIYLGGMFAETSNTTISNSSVNLSVDVESEIYYFKLTNKVYVGAISAKAKNTNVEKATIAFSMTAQENSVIDFVGGAFGYYSSTNKTHTIVSTDVTIEMSGTENQPKILMFGGLIGYAQNATIVSCEIDGTYSRKSMNYDAYIGGIIGYSNNADISNSGSLLTLDLTFNGTSNKWLGGLVGWLTTIDSGASTISNCYFTEFDENNQQTTIQSNTEFVLGIYGNVIPGTVSINGMKTDKSQN